MIRIILLFSLPIFAGIDIGKINALKSEAKKAYNAGDYKTAAQKYTYLIDSMGIQEDELVLNLANARFNLNDTTAAQNGYRQLTASSNNLLKSAAYQQLGVMSTKQSKLEEALQNFREALKANPANEEARYNYELVKKKLEEQKKKEQNQQNKDQKENQQKKQDQQNKQDQKDNKQNQDKKENKDQKQDQEKKDSEQKDKKSEEQKKKEEENKEQNQKEEKDKKPNFDPDKMKQMKVTEDKAKMILEAMKRNEVQYLQQNRRKATKPKDKSKPDW